MIEVTICVLNLLRILNMHSILFQFVSCLDRLNYAFNFVFVTRKFNHKVYCQKKKNKHKKKKKNKLDNVREMSLAGQGIRFAVKFN